MTEFKDEQYVTFDTVESLRNKRKAILSFHTVVEENRLLNELISDLLTALKAAKCALDAPRDSMIFNMAEEAIEKAIEKAEKVK